MTETTTSVGTAAATSAIDSSFTGEIQVVAPLDFEAEREYALRIRLRMQAAAPAVQQHRPGQHPGGGDINDHTPIFVSTPLPGLCPGKCTLGYPVIHIQAVDADHGENSRLEYSQLVWHLIHLVINSATGWVSVSGPLDRESVEHYFGVEARDHGSPHFQPQPALQ